MDWAWIGWCLMAAVIAFLVEPDRVWRSIVIYACILALGALVASGAL